MTATYLPQTINRAVVTAGLVALVGLALYQPVVFLGALSGTLLGIGVAGLSGSPGRISIAAAVFPIGLVTLTAVVGGLAAGIAPISGLHDGSGASVYVAIATLVAGLLALLLVATLSGEVTERNFGNAGASTLSGVFFGSIIAAAAMFVIQQGSLDSVALALGTGFTGFFSTIALATVALVLGAVAIPNAALTGPGRKEQVVTRKRRFAVAVSVLSGVVLGALLLADVVGDWAFVDAALESPVIRVPLLSIAALGIFVAALGGIASYSWSRTDSSENAIVPVLLGTVLGVSLLIVAGIASGISPGLLFVVPGLCGGAGLGLLLLWWVYGWLETEGSFRDSLPTLLSLLCVTGTVAIGADVGDSLGLSLSGLGATLTLGAGLFIYSAGQYGTTLTDELPAGDIDRMPQLVQIAYAGSVVGIGTLFAVGGFLAAMVLTPQFSSAAIVGLTGALVALIALVTYLRSQEGIAAS